MVEEGRYRVAMARLGAAVNIVTTDGIAGRRLHCLSGVFGHRRASYPACLHEPQGHFRDGILAISAPTSLHQDLSGLFAGKART